jgi:hypothetical protein
MENMLFDVLSRLLATIGRVVMLARSRQQKDVFVLLYSLLDAVCHLTEAIEKSLQDGRK